LYDDPYSEDEILESLESMMEGNLQKVLGVPVYMERKKVRE
jgi:hypothetical protein